VQLDNQEWRIYLNTIQKDSPIEEAYHIYRSVWCADYPDENNWVHEVFHYQAGANRLRRNCADPNCQTFTGPGQFDMLTEQAARSTDPAERVNLYAQAEDILSGEEAAYIPLYHYTLVKATKPWLARNYPPIGGIDLYNWKIDQEAQLSAR
jgi:oligopeptide transport system substrate-binding protein